MKQIIKNFDNYVLAFSYLDNEAYMNITEPLSPYDYIIFNEDRSISIDKTKTGERTSTTGYTYLKDGITGKILLKSKNDDDIFQYISNESQKRNISVLIFPGEYYLSKTITLTNSFVFHGATPQTTLISSANPVISIDASTAPIVGASLKNIVIAGTSTQDATTGIYIYATDKPLTNSLFENIIISGTINIGIHIKYSPPSTTPVPIVGGLIG